MDVQHARPAIRVAVAAPFEQLVGLHARAAEYADEIELCGAISDADRVLEQARRLQPEVLLLSAELGVGGEEFTERLATLAPATRLVLLVDGAPDAIRGVPAVAAAAGAAELRGAIVGAARPVEVETAPPAHLRPGSEPDVTPDATAADQDASVTSDKPSEGRSRSGAHLVVVFGGKGGVGKSVVAANLATVLARSGARVGLLDLNLQFGDAGLLLRVESHPATIERVAYAAAAGALDDAALENAMATTAEGLRVLLSPRSPEAADLVTAAGLQSVLAAMARRFDHLVVDTPAHLEERVVAAIEAADSVLLVTSASLTAVKDAKATLRLFQSLGIERDRVGVVLNLTAARSRVTAADVERALHFPVRATLEFEARMEDCIDRGVPVVVRHASSPFSAGVRHLAEHEEQLRVRERQTRPAG